MKNRKIVKERIPSSYRYICNIYKKRYPIDERDTEITIDLYQCDETETYYLYYKRWVFSFQFAAGSICLARFYLEISEKERNASEKEVIQLVESIRV